MRTVLVDVTQFQRNPARTGIQRIIKAFVDFSRSSKSPFKFIFHHKNEIFQIQIDKFQEHLDSYWNNRIDSTQIQSLIWELRRPLPENSIAGAIYLLPEITYVEDHYNVFRRISRIASTAAIIFDMFPMTHPSLFSDTGHKEFSKYVRNLCEFDLLISISDFTMGVFNQVFARPPKIVVNTLGCDVQSNFVGSQLRKRNQYLVLGTVEPRKNHLLIFEAFRELNSKRSDKLELDFVGRQGWIPIWQAEYLRKQSENCEWFTWVTDASDLDVKTLLSESNCLVSVGLEGFGLPIFEARSLGCHVIFEGIQPAGELLEDENCVRIQASSFSELAGEIDRTHKYFSQLSYVSKHVRSWAEYVESTISIMNMSLA